MLWSFLLLPSLLTIFFISYFWHFLGSHSWITEINCRLIGYQIQGQKIFINIQMDIYLNGFIDHSIEFMNEFLCKGFHSLLWYIYLNTYICCNQVFVLKKQFQIIYIYKTTSHIYLWMDSFLPAMNLGLYC